MIASLTECFDFSKFFKLGKELKIVKEIPEVNHRSVKEIQLVGRGAFGSVYKAVFNTKIVAMKVFENKNDQFLNEMKNLCTLIHPNIVEFVGKCVGTEEHGLSFFIEWMDNGSLNQLIYNPKIVYSLGRLLSWCKQCSDALMFMHQYNFAHRDLKPDNMLLSNNYSKLKLTDFAIAKMIEKSMTAHQGTLFYMAPEVVAGNTKYNVKCDIYSFGIILWELFARRVPYKNFGTSYSLSVKIV